MLTADLLRDARRRSGLSVRAAAQRCGVPRGTWAGWESGTSSPSLRRLDEVLRTLALDLRLVDRATEPAGEHSVRRHLRCSLTTRARHALGDQLPVVLAACRSGPRLLTGPAAVGVWVPHVVARGPLSLPPVPDVPGLVRLRLDDIERGSGTTAAVPTPSALVGAGLADTWPGLLTSARLLAQERPRDLAGRALPPHRDPDEEREVRDLAQTLTWGARPPFPVSPLDSRAWRLGADATLEAALARQGFPPRHPRRDR